MTARAFSIGPLALDIFITASFFFWGGELAVTILPEVHE